MSSILLASAFASGAAAAKASPHDNHEIYAPPSPDQLNARFDLVAPNGARVTNADLKGRWALIYFGYARCTATCPIAVPTALEAARRLKAGGLKTQVVFVDIDAMMTQPVRLRSRSGEGGAHAHAHAGPAGPRFTDGLKGDDLLTLSGSRLQLNQATVAFRVNREHVPARPGEHGHSINHSSLIYILAPDGRVAGYAYHDVRPEELVATVERLAGRGA